MTIGRGLLEYISQFGTPAVWRLQWGSQLPNLFFELHFSHLVKKWHDLQKWGSNSNMSLVFDVFPTWRVLSLAEIYYWDCCIITHAQPHGPCFVRTFCGQATPRFWSLAMGNVRPSPSHRLQPKVLCSRVIPTKRSVWVMRIFWPPVKPVENFLSHSSSKACRRFKTITGTLAPSHFNRKSRKAASRRLSRE